MSTFSAQLLRKTCIRVAPIAVMAAVGTALAAAPASANGHAEFTPSGALTFSATAVGATSGAQTETISNAGDFVTLTFDEPVTLTGANPGDFEITQDHCGNTIVAGLSNCTVVVVFKPTAVGVRTANLHFVFSGIRTDPTSPQDVAVTGTATAPLQQTPLKRCVTAPSSIPVQGTRRLLKPHCRTNAGQAVAVTVTGQQRGDVAFWKVQRKGNGSVYLKTRGYRLKLRVVWSAPATPGFTAYSLVRTYRS